MPRVRKPNAEVTEQDKRIVYGAAITIAAIGKRHANEKLLLAAELVNAFVESPTATPKPRSRKPKEPRSLNEAMWRDGKSAAANDDTRALAHHSV